VDYHYRTGGVIAADGKIKITASTHRIETVVSHRSYLCDASFLVAVQAAPEWIERLEAAVRSPTWPLYLGRKSCPPARRFLRGPANLLTWKKPWRPGRAAAVASRAEGWRQWSADQARGHYGGTR